ncbi:hypothetical protein MYX76_18375, partial [Desulfobacterota bacterium AH_259_B03_O07]|nr:hypothetical protein [Desulfobacterota bacterium AH_259_B03_O07]
MLDTGLVGIASTTPTGLLSIENTGSGYTFYATDDTDDTSPFVINASGNVGIGISNPARTLHVKSTDTAWSGVAGIQLDTGDDIQSRVAIIHQIESASLADDGGLHFAITQSNGGVPNNPTVSDTKLFINELGNVGIGTTSPNWLLQANGTRPFFTLSDDSAGTDLKHWYLSSQGGNLYVGTTIDTYATTTGYQAFTILN